MTFKLDMFDSWVSAIDTAAQERRQCEKCGTIYDSPDDGDIHFPHDEGCQDRQGCQCDHVVCSKCCWEC